MAFCSCEDTRQYTATFPGFTWPASPVPRPVACMSAVENRRWFPAVRTAGNFPALSHRRNVRVLTPASAAAMPILTRAIVLDAWIDRVLLNPRIIPVLSMFGQGFGSC